MKFFAVSLALCMLAAAAPSPNPTAATPFAAGDFGPALAAARTAIAADPADADARLTAGTIELYQNDLDAAKADLAAIPAGTPAAARAQRPLEELAHRERLARHADTTFGASRAVVPFLHTDPLPTVAVLVNGHRGVFQIDTGAPGLSVDPAFAARLHLPAAHSAHIGVFAAGPRQRIAQATVASFSLGGTTIRNLPADLLLLRMMAGPGDPVIDGVIGTDIFARFVAVTLDYAHGRLLLYAPGTPVRTDVETRVPLWIAGDHFLITRGTIANSDGAVLIDTGLLGGGVAPSAAVVERAHLVAHDAGMGLVPSGAQVSMRRVVVPTVRIGTSIEHDVAGFYSPGPSPLDIFPFTVTGAISHQFFRHRALTIDFATMQLLISRRVAATAG